MKLIKEKCFLKILKYFFKNPIRILRKYKSFLFKMDVEQNILKILEKKGNLIWY